MPTVRDIITRAARRIRLISPAEILRASDAEVALDALNDMFSAWSANEVQTLSQGFALNDEFVFFVPPKDLDSVTSTTTTMDYLTYQGAWNASTNSPALVSATGTRGDVYRVSTAGSTTLDDVTSWSLDDYAVFNGTEWLKGRSPARHHAGIIAMLGVRLCDDFGKDVTPVLKRDADDGLETLLADYVKPPHASFDAALTRLPSRRWPYSVPSSETS